MKILYRTRLIRKSSPVFFLFLAPLSRNRPKCSRCWKCGRCARTPFLPTIRLSLSHTFPYFSHSFMSFIFFRTGADSSPYYVRVSFQQRWHKQFSTLNSQNLLRTIRKTNIVLSLTFQIKYTQDRDAGIYECQVIKTKTHLCRNYVRNLIINTKGLNFTGPNLKKSPAQCHLSWSLYSGTTLGKYGIKLWGFSKNMGLKVMIPWNIYENIIKHHCFV